MCRSQSRKVCKEKHNTWLQESQVKTRTTNQKNFVFVVDWNEELPSTSEKKSPIPPPSIRGAQYHFISWKLVCKLNLVFRNVEVEITALDKAKLYSNKKVTMKIGSRDEQFSCNVEAFVFRYLRLVSCPQRRSSLSSCQYQRTSWLTLDLMNPTRSIYQ